MREHKGIDRSFDVVYLVTIFINTVLIIKNNMIFSFYYGLKNAMNSTRIINYDKIELLKSVWNINLIVVLGISALVIAMVALKKRSVWRVWIIYLFFQLTYIFTGEYLCSGISHIENYTFSFGLGIFSIVDIAVLSIIPIMYLLRRCSKKTNF